MMRTPNPTAYFTKDIGNVPNRTLTAFLQGPLVLTYLDPAAEVEVYDGHPAKSDNDAPLVARLSGAIFRGSFYVGHAQTIIATTPCAVVSGYETNPELSRLENKIQVLREGGRLIYRPLGDSEISIPFTGDPTNSKLAAVREVETLLGCGIAVIHDWQIAGERWVLDFCVAPNSLTPKFAHVAPTPPPRNPDFIDHDPNAKIEVYDPEADPASESGHDFLEKQIHDVLQPFISQMEIGPIAAHELQTRLVQALNLKEFEHKLQQAQASIASRHMIPSRVSSGESSPMHWRYKDAWSLLDDICNVVAHEKNQTDVPHIKVQFIVDVPTCGMGFSLQTGEKEKHFLLGYMHLFEPKPEGMPDALWRVFREDAHRMLDLAKLIEQGVPREGLAEAMNRSAT